MSRELLNKLRRTLAKIDRPGSFCASGQGPAVPPGLEVEGLGTVSLPLTAAQARKLKALCEQAPYGKGEQTLVDPSVRKVWRLTPGKFRLANPDWKTFLADVVERVQVELGLERQKLQAHLYDLLLYEKGSFFLPHQDGEKLDRMVATLVIVLPSSFEGGELVVRHEGEEKVLDFGGGQDPFHHHWAAFYADCEHEVRPLQAGYRLCLIYNLTLAKGKKGLPAPSRQQQVEALAHVLQEWAAKPGSGKLVYTLEHKYTKNGLAWDALKGVDRARALALVEAARRADCRTCLGLLTYHESGSAVEDYEEDRYGRSRWDDREDEDDAFEDDEFEEDEFEDGDEDGDDFDEEVEGEYEMEEVIDSDLEGEGFLDPDGQRPGFERLGVEEDELVDPKRLRSVKPEEEFEGYTGNEGMTLDRWYRHGAVFLWPRRRQFDVMCHAGTGPAVGLFTAMVDRWKGLQKGGDELRQDCAAFAGSIISCWQPHHVQHDDKDQSSRFFKALADLDNVPLLSAYVKEVLTRDCSEDPGAALAAVCRKHGVGPLREGLEVVFRATGEETPLGFSYPKSPERDVGVLERVCVARGQKDRDDCRRLAQTLLKSLEKLDEREAARPQFRDEDEWLVPRRDHDEEHPEPLAGMVRALVALEDDKLLERLVEHVLAHPRLYPLRETLVPALKTLAPWLAKNLKRPSPPLQRCLAHVRSALEELTASKPEPPADFRREAPIRCTCADCRQLKNFLEDPQAQQDHFAAIQNRRTHREEVIRRHRLDLDCLTVKRARPHALVCTKNTRSFEDRLRTFRQDEVRLAEIKALQEQVSRAARKK